VTEDFTVSEVIGVECCENKNDEMQLATAFSAPRV
jgi:hypothetical protein